MIHFVTLVKMWRSISSTYWVTSNLTFSVHQASIEMKYNRHKYTIKFIHIKDKNNYVCNILTKFLHTNKTIRYINMYMYTGLLVI